MSCRHQGRGKPFETEGKAHGLEFYLMVFAVHGGDARGNVPLVVDILTGFRFFRIQDDLAQSLHEIVYPTESCFGVVFVELLPEFC